MNIKRAKEEIKDTIAAYLLKDEFGEYKIPAIRQRPVLLIGPPGVGKTQIMEQRLYLASGNTYLPEIPHPSQIVWIWARYLWYHNSSGIF